MAYVPDYWEAVEFTDKETNEKQVRILGGWVGGYLDADYWRLSSGVTEVKDAGDHYVVTNRSGSTYYCYKEARGLILVTSSIYNQLTNNPTYSIKIVGLSVQVKDEDKDEDHHTCEPAPDPT